ncbi:PRC-barrel domain-containing protein [Christiangramia aquimixticola]|uniref:PRC-barrel domain-containing protein n=1 Tax=Christiangramia aquimixticola TaxID=1697558 RepID=UPI003AA83CB5
MKDQKNKNLYYLDELSDYKVKSDDPDVRGWEVIDKDRRKVGKVDNLLVNKSTEKVVYLDVEVDSSIIEANHKPYSGSASKGVHEFLNKDGENHIIIPIGLVNLDADNKRVLTNEITHQTFAETKRKERGALVERNYEVVVLESYNRDENMTYPEDDSLYDRKEYDTKNFRTS